MIAVRDSPESFCSILQNCDDICEIEFLRKIDARLRTIDRVQSNDIRFGENYSSNITHGTLLRSIEFTMQCARRTTAMVSEHEIISFDSIEKLIVGSSSDHVDGVAMEC